MFSCLLPGGPAGLVRCLLSHVHSAGHLVSLPLTWDGRNAELSALQVTAEWVKDPHVPVHLWSSSVTPPLYLPNQALGHILFPLHVPAGLVFHGVTASVSPPPHERLLISAPVVGVLPTGPSCTAASGCVSLHRSTSHWTSWGWVQPIFWCKESETSYCKTTGGIFDILPASEVWS